MNGVMNRSGRVDSPYWFEFDRTVLEWQQREDNTWAHVPVGSKRLLAQVLTLSIETGNMRVRTFEVETEEPFGTFDMKIEEFYKNFEIFKRTP